MATLYISAYTSAGSVAQGPVSASTTVAVGGSWTASSAIGATGTVLRVRLVTDTACLIEKGASPDGSGLTEYLPANAIEYHWLTGGHKIACKTP